MITQFTDLSSTTDRAQWPKATNHGNINDKTILLPGPASGGGDVGETHRQEQEGWDTGVTDTCMIRGAGC